MFFVTALLCLVYSSTPHALRPRRVAGVVGRGRVPRRPRWTTARRATMRAVVGGVSYKGGWNSTSNYFVLFVFFGEGREGAGGGREDGEGREAGMGKGGGESARGA